MYFTGFADEAATGIDKQIAVTKELGWKYFESRFIDGENIHDLPEDQFEVVCEKLAEAGIGINCFGSSVANWSWDPMNEEHFVQTKAQLTRALTRMKKLNCKMIRGMSFKAQWNKPAFDEECEKVIFRKVNELVKMCEDADVLYLHENCNNYGGMSWKHTLKLLDNVKSPNFKLVFDTGNPVMNYDRSNGDKLEKMQSSWEFYDHVKEFIHYVHIKDGFCLEPSAVSFAKCKFTFAGEGNGDVRKIVTDLLKRGYDGGFSMEPHMGSVFHDQSGNRDYDMCYKNYIEYGQKFMALVDDVKKSLK